MKSALVGSLAGALVFAALRLVTAQTALSVTQFHQNQRGYVGSMVQITGVARNIRQEMKKVNGREVPYIKLNLYEDDVKGKKSRYYVYVALPTSQMKSAINEGDNAAIVGKMQW